MNDVSKLTVQQLSKRFMGADSVPAAEEIAVLERDPRTGVRRIASILRKRMDRTKAEKSRIDSMLSREKTLWKQGVSYIAGVDEVGVGPFAGPVVAAAVVFPRGIRIDGIRDSKRLDHDRRIKLDEIIRQSALGVGIGLVDVDEIDRMNIYQAALKAMRLALLNVKIKVQHVLVDGRRIPAIGIPQEVIVDGDDTVFSIASASIVAKVYRDTLMILYDREFPQYGFARHKGYGTAEHIRALREHGPCEIHRRSFNWGGDNAMAPGTGE
jgi:ribonuclease HII